MITPEPGREPTGKSALVVDGGWRIHANLFPWSLPGSINVEVTNDCDLRCTHCFHRYYRFPQGHIAPSLFGDLKPLLRKIGRVALSSAGEPLLNPDFPRYLGWCLEQGLEVMFTTNGHLLDRHIDAIVGRDVHLIISIDAASPEMYRRRRGKGFARVLHNLEVLKQRKREHGTDLPRLQFGFAASAENIHELPALVELAARLDVPTVYGYHQVFYDPARFAAGSMFHDQERFDRHLVEAGRLAQSLGIDLVHPGGFSAEIPTHPAGEAYVRGRLGDFDCRWIHENTTISWNGIVMACCFVDRMFMGTVQGVDFEDVWHGPHYRKLRTSLARREYPAACEQCLFRQILTRQDEKSFRCGIHEPALYDESLAPHQPYSIRDLDRGYREACRMLRDGEATAASARLRALRAVDPELFEAANALGVALVLDDRPDEARRVFAQATATYPPDGLAAKNVSHLSG